MNDDPQLIVDIYNIFLPSEPLPPGDPLYVNCEKLRGDSNIEQQLGRKIIRANTSTCQLYTGHRGSGKSTELLRLKQYLENNKCFVVYFSADEEDIDSEDTQYSDILLACTRHLLQDVQQSNPDPILHWLRDRWSGLKELGLTKVELENLGIEAAIATFGKITANLRTEPSQRAKIRQLVQPHTITLIKALNEFIDDAKNHLPLGKTKLVVIVDSLDRIVPVIQEDGHTNHEHIFIGRSNQLQGLNCHVIYTVPISLRYSDRAPDLFDRYGNIPVLPIIMVQNPDAENKNYNPGLAKINEIIQARINKIQPNISLENQIFENSKVLENICLMSGGHVRQLIQLIQGAIVNTDQFPITQKAANLSITTIRNIYRCTIEEKQWFTLAEVNMHKQMDNSYKYRELMFNRCILEYVYFNDRGELVRWCDVQPLIKELPKFKEALDILNNKSQEASTTIDYLIKNENYKVDFTILSALEDLDKLYNSYLESENYQTIIELADYACEMLNNIKIEINRETNSEIYNRLVALVEYWKLRRNLYSLKSSVSAKE